MSDFILKLNTYTVLLGKIEMIQEVLKKQLQEVGKVDIWGNVRYLDVWQLALFSTYLVFSFLMGYKLEI